MIYTHSCVEAVGADIDAMTAAAAPITLRTFKKHAKDLESWAKAHGYDVGNERGGLRLPKDWHVGYFRSTYRGRPCVFLVWSAYECIWS